MSAPNPLLGRRSSRLLAMLRVFAPAPAVAVIEREPAAVIGFTSIFSYASTLLSGWGLGALVQHHGWNAALAGMTGMAALGTVLFALAWPAKVHGYAAAPASPRLPSTGHAPAVRTSRLL